MAVSIDLEHCPFCRESIAKEAIVCKHCNQPLGDSQARWYRILHAYRKASLDDQATFYISLSDSEQNYLDALLEGRAHEYDEVASAPAPPQKSDLLAGCLGLLLGPVGLWYKGHWMAGFAWLAMALIVGIFTGGLGLLAAPVFWFGMAIHAFVASPRA